MENEANSNFEEPITATSNVEQQRVIYVTDPDVQITWERQHSNKPSRVEGKYKIGEDIGKLNCAHRFHWTCIQEWLASWWLQYLTNCLRWREGISLLESAFGSLQFHEHIITELLEDTNGGLVILSSGLSLSKLISSLLLLHSTSQGTLLILSPSSATLKSKINFHLKTLNPQFYQVPVEITADLPVNHRHSLYSSGSVCFITPRILIVDLLTNKLPASIISGLIILNAHSVSETSTEAFIVRIFRSLNRSAFVRVFSDRPQAMVSGFAKAERTMKCFHIRKLHLWPRFQVYVSQELEQDPPDVVDIRVPMSKYMIGIQKAIVEVMGACLKEMRKTNKVDVEDLTVENGLFKSFDEIVRRQLDPIWHTLGKQTKQLVSDLKTLRKLLDYLVRYDVVTYLKYLDTLRVSESFRSVWIFAEASYKIFDYAKKRVYHLVRSDGMKLDESSKGVKNKKKKVKGDNKDTEEKSSRFVLVA
ncbi:DNA repair endonuclease UVH1-like [Lathyrus oleraceus]|uniref:DNA repair endonuclease UVH1-like n=1 Tax=Pisum sativum TaxID=3888 RepID=UPI0021CEDCD6|nr:DNA repair endonuclease UVH1-like [Pisum sativum]